MSRKLFTPMAIGVLSAAFALVSLLVILSRRHPYFVRKKLRIGALLIGLTGVTLGCPTTTCYVPVPDNVFTVDQAEKGTGEIVVQSGATITLTGTVSQRRGEEFSYAVIDTAGSPLHTGNLVADDGSFDQSEERFSIQISTSLTTGDYELRLYTHDAASITNSDWYARSFALRVTG